LFRIFKSKDSWRNQKYPARVGYAKIRNGLWYEYRSDMTWRPTFKTKLILAFKKNIWKRPTFKTANRFLIFILTLPIIKQCTKLEDLTST
jgi:hypothetical protein